MIASEVAKSIGLKDKGKHSFILLCKKGCDAGELGNYFKLLTIDPEVSISRRYVGERKRFPSSLGHAERINDPERSINIRPMDSLKRALGGFEKRDLVPLQKKLKKVSVEIQNLNNSNLVRRMDRRKHHPEVFQLPELLNYYADKFLKLVLGESKKIGEKQKPDYSKLMKGLYKYVRDNTKGWHDALLADVFNELTPDRKDTEQSLKEWRKRHGILERKATRKSKKM